MDVVYELFEYFKAIKFEQSKDYTINSLKWNSQALNSVSNLYYLANLIISIISVESFITSKMLRSSR